MEKNLCRLRAFLISFLLLLIGLPSHARQNVSASYVPTIYGIVLNSSGWPSNNPLYGVYSFMPDKSVIVTSPEHLDNWMRANSGGVWFNRRLHYMNSLQGSGNNVLNEYQCWNTDTWELETEYQMTSSESYKLAADLTYDPTTEQVFGIFFTDDGAAYELGTMQFSANASPVKNSIKRLPIDMVAIAASAEGEVFGIGLNGVLYKFDKTTGDATVVGDTGVTPEGYRQSATIDFRSGKMYWAAMLSASSSALYEVNTTTGKATRLGTFANNEEVVALYIPFGLADDNAPSTAEQLSVNFVDGSLTGQFSFAIPTENYATEPLTGTVNYRVLVDDVLQKDGTSSPGATVTADLTLTEGVHVFTVVLSNEAGESLPAKLSAYIGYDTPVAVTNPMLTIDNDTYEATVTWEAPARGVNNGYLDRRNLKYIVKRYPDASTLETDWEGTTYYDELPHETGLRSYYYTIQPYVGDKMGAIATTPTINVGQAEEIPWTEDFSRSINFSQFTVLDVNNDKYTWTYENSSKSAVCSNNSLYNANDDDDWLITPPLHLQGDRLYDLEFETSSEWLWDRAREEQMEVGFGDNASAQDYEIVIERRIIQQAEENIPLKLTAKLRPKKEGTYFVGFHAVTPVEPAFKLYIHNISVVESSLLSSPDSVTNLRVEPAAKGALRATVRFNAPTRNLMGEPLTALTQIQILRNNEEVIATFNAPEPGQELSYEDTKAVNGINTYVVVPFSGDHKGQASRVSGYVGIDFPKAPRNIKATLVSDGIRITWDAPGEVGVNGGYVDTEDLIYQVADKNGNLLPGASELYDTEFTDKNVKLTGQQVTNQYYVLPYSELGAHSQGLGLSNVVVTGDPYSLPIHESFANGGASYLWVLQADQNDYGFKTTKQEYADDDMGALYFSGSEYFASVAAEVGSGKISLKGAGNPRWSFSYKPYVGHNVVATCKVQTSDFETHDVMTIDFKKLTGSNEWRKAVIDLTPYKDSEWVRVIVRVVISGGVYQYTMDAINIEDVPDCDLAASIYVPKTMRANTPKDVRVTVKDLGARSTADYSVRLMANGVTIAEKPGVSINPLDSVTFDFAYNAAPNDPENITFQGFVDSASDVQTDNNVTSSVATRVLPSLLPAVQNLQGRDDDGQVVLTWQAPDVSNPWKVTDDFEDYSSWLVDGFGQWKVYDQDKGRTYDMSGSKYPNMSMETSFMIFNNSEVSGTIYSNMNGHSGEQVAASFDAIPSRTSLRHTADWMISPKLSGEAQTVKFFARSVAESYLETMEVAYTTGTATAYSAYKSVRTVSGVPNAWTEYTVELPEGAQYFAIKNISTDKMALIVDDVTYEPTPLVLTGYDVYVDGQKVATVSADQLQWTAAGSSAQHGYQVVAVYEQGESSLSSAYGLVQGIDGTLVQVDLTQADVEVYTVDGKRVAQGRGAWQQVGRGVYMVRMAATGQTVKLMKR